MIRTFSFYDATTGIFNGRRISISNHDRHEAEIAANAGPGHTYIEGRYDHESQRVDIVAGIVVDYQPPQPSADHEWNASAKRWHLSAAVSSRNQARDVALAAIARLEASQPRAMRDFVLRGDNSRILAIDAEIERLRADL